MLAILLGCLVLLAGTPVRAAIPEAKVDRVEVDLVIHRGRTPGPDGRRVRRNAAVVEGRATYVLSEATEQPRELVLLDFAGHVDEEPVQLDEVQAEGYVDGPWRPGRLEVLEPSGHTRGEGRHEVRVPVPAGVDRIELRYRVAVPRRYWPFGCSGRRCSLSGAVAPLPSARARGGRYHDRAGRVIRPVRWRTRARFADLPDWEPGTSPTEAQAKQLRGDQLHVFDRNGRGGDRLGYPVVVWGRGWRRLDRSVRGVRVTVLTMAPEMGGDHPFESPLTLYRDLDGRLMTIAREVVEVADAARAPLGVDAPLVMIQGPLRSGVAQSHPGAVLVSDQAFQLVPGDRFAKFHDTVVARASLETMAHGWFAGRQAPSEMVWVPGMVGYALTRVWQFRREHRDEYAQDILRNLTFVPAVDRLLYTGQARFSSSYFRGAEDDLPLRNHPALFAHDLPTGRRIDEKLRDLMADDKLQDLYRELLDRPGADVRRLAERSYGYELHWFFDQWLGPYPKVDYAIVDLRSEETDEGWRHEIVVARVSEGALVEPLQVLATEKGGERHYLLWNGDEGELEDHAVPAGEGQERVEHTFHLETSGKLKSVRLDPRRRLEQTPLIPARQGARADNLDPRFNDRTPHQARFLYTGFGLSLAASEFANATTPAARLNAFSGFAAFEASLQRDLRRNGTFVVFKDRETIGGFGASLNNDFLGKRNRQRRRLRLRLNVSGSALSKQSLDPEGGARLVETLSLIDFTERFAWWPEKGHRIIGSVSVAHTFRPGGDQRHSMTFLAGWAQLWPIVRGHTLATSLTVATMVPLSGEPEFRSLLRAGGIAGLAGYSADEIFGRAVTLAQMEYRHALVRNLAWNFAHVGWLREIGGSAFGGVASMSSCDGFEGWFGADSWYGQVGYGLWGKVQLLGVTPQLVRLDLAVPLTRRDTQCLGQTLPGYLAEFQGLDASEASQLLPPFNINLVFNHPF